MRQHAILSCSILLLVWAALMGYPLLMSSIQGISIISLKLLYWALLPLIIISAMYRRDRLKKVLFRANVWGFLGAWLLLGLHGLASPIPFLGRGVTACLLVPAIVVASLGWRAAWVLAFPCLSVLLLVPFHEPLLSAIEWILWHLCQSHLPNAALSFHQAAPLEARTSLSPLLNWTPQLFVLIVFSGYLAYESLWQRSIFYGSAFFLGILLGAFQLVSLSNLLDFSGLTVLQRLNTQQFTQVGLVLLGALLIYLMAISIPKRPRVRRMMADSSDFRVLVDRHSHWFALTTVTLLMMLLSGWLSQLWRDCL